MMSAAQRAAAEALVARAGLGGGASFTQLEGGGNNRVYRAVTPKGEAALKVYFHHANDPRDRLGTEFGFSTVAWEQGIRCIPRPLGMDAEHRLGLYEFVTGTRPDTVDAVAIDEAIAFLKGLGGAARAGASIPPGSEACFSLDAHLDTVERRLGRLAAVKTGALAGFIDGELSPVWREISAHVRKSAEAALGLDPGAEISPSERCLSPSDFGFHNALRTPGGSLKFLDFEYAGWDDPAKLVGDFFNQVAVPVPMAHYPRFARAVADLFPDSERNLARFDLLLPVYTVKWITIMLNDFLPEGGKRRGFAGGTQDSETRKARQLQKAERALGALRDKHGPRASAAAG